MSVSERRLNAAMGRVLAGYRGELRMSQNEFGMLLGGIGQRTVSAMEDGLRAMRAAEIVLFSERLAAVLPYSEDEIKSRFLDGRTLMLVQDLDSQPPDSETGGTLIAA